MIRSKLKSVVGRLLGGGGAKPAPSTKSPSPAAKPSAAAKAAPAASGDEGEGPKVEIESFEVAAWLDIGQRPFFVDIRELHELRQGHVEGALLLPMNQVPERLADLPKGRPLVIYCAAGARSFGVAHYLREQGFTDAWSLVGGLGTWFQESSTKPMRPPSDAKFGLLDPVRVTEAAAARLGRDTASAARAGTVQEVREAEGGHVYVLGLASAGGMEFVEGLAVADLEPIARR